MLRMASRWACIWFCAVTLLTAGWTTPARADGETAPTTSWLWAWTWDWVTWAEEFGFDMTAWTLNQLPCTGQVCENSQSYAGTERFYWTTGYLPPTGNAITGASIVYDHVSLGPPGSSATVRFDCGESNSGDADRFVLHDLWVHFTQPTPTNGHYLEQFVAYACGPTTGNTHQRYSQGEEHEWWVDNNGQRWFRSRPSQRRTLTDFDNNWRYTIDRHDYRWHLHSACCTDTMVITDGPAPVGRAIEWGTEASFNGGNLYQAHVRIQDTRHQYGEGNGYFPHDQNGFNSTMEAPWGGHIGVYTNPQGQKFNNGVHTCTYSSTCGG